MAGHWDFQVAKGESFDEPIQVVAGGVPLDMTGYVARMQVRDPSGALLIELNSDTNNRILVNVPPGWLRLTISPAETAVFRAGVYAYDLFLEQGSQVALRLLEGRFAVHAAVTHP